MHALVISFRVDGQDQTLACRPSHRGERYLILIRPNCPYCDSAAVGNPEWVLSEVATCPSAQSSWARSIACGQCHQAKPLAENWVYAIEPSRALAASILIKDWRVLNDC